MKKNTMSTARIFCAALPLLFAFSMRAGAAFEDTPPCAAAMGMAGSAAALEMPGCFGGNPALYGSARKFALSTDFLSSMRVPQGAADFRAYSVGAVLPRMSQGRFGTIGIGGAYRDDGGSVTEKTIFFGVGTWQLAETQVGAVDFGANFKILQAAAVKGGESKAGAAADAGALLRLGEGRTLGFSVLNLNNPSLSAGPHEGRAPVSLHLGAAEKRDDYTLSVELARRTASSSGPGNFSVASGVEHLFRQYRGGVFASRTGLFLAERSAALGLGVGFNRQASEISYSLSLPLSGTIVAAHAVTFVLRFGERDVESEYDRIMRQEIKYRKDLLMALDESAVREALLREQLLALKADIDGMAAKLRAAEGKKLEVRDAREKLETIIARQRGAEEELKALEEKRKADKLASLRFDFSLDWQNYLKLKSGRAPAGVLRGVLQRLVAQYQDSGIDISQATVELRGLVGN